MKKGILKKGKSKNKVGYKLSVLIIVISVVMFANLQISGVIYRWIIDSEMETLGKSGMTQLEKQISDIEDMQAGYANLFATDQSFAQYIQQRNVTGLSSNLNLMLKDKRLDFATVVDKNGQVLASKNSKNEGVNLSQISHIKIALSGSTNVAIEKGFDSSLGQYTGFPVKDADGKIVGAISLGSDLTASKYLDVLKNETGNEYTIFLGDERINTTLINTDGTRAVGTKIGENVSKRVLEGKQTYYLKNVLFGKRYASVYTPFKDSQGNVIGILYSGVPINEIMDRVDKNVFASTLMAIFLVLLSLVAGLYYIKKSISEPIYKVTRLANKISKGEMGIRENEEITLNIKSKDEIGELASALENTVKMLKAYIGDISYVVNHMAQGDLTVEPNVEYKGDLVYIKEAFLLILESLNSSMKQINVSANEVASGADQVSSGAQLLSQGATEQASEVEQLSGLIKDVTKKISLNAQNAALASELTNNSYEIVSNSKDSMENLRNAMADINEVTAKMKKIVKTIDNFAYQTNILALNATVEAARAGAHGHGFAVVADEVRSLANKSAAAAKETNELIENTVQIVESGVLLSKEAGESFDRVVELVNEISEKVESIAEASNDQAMAASQIVNSVDEISRVVQTNSATAEESAAASEELSSLAHVLNQVVAKFKLR
ncbi:MAG: methyl-accepting chemotaxis protein [Clostridia bacterium]|nr:methyl-accepting chemotaxis protein [Clostridia bacterium]